MCVLCVTMEYMPVLAYRCAHECVSMYSFVCAVPAYAHMQYLVCTCDGVYMVPMCEHMHALDMMCILHTHMSIGVCM